MIQNITTELLYFQLEKGIESQSKFMVDKQFKLRINLIILIFSKRKLKIVLYVSAFILKLDLN